MLLPLGNFELLHRAVEWEGMLLSIRDLLVYFVKYRLLFNVPDVKYYQGYI